MTVIRVWSRNLSEWSAANPVLEDGRLGFERDTKRLKVGDGTTAWNSLAYVDGSGQPPRYGVVAPPSFRSEGTTVRRGADATGDMNNAALELLMRVTYALDIVDRVQTGVLTAEKAVTTLDAAVTLLKRLGQPDAVPIVDFPLTDAQLAMFRDRVDHARDRMVETFALLLTPTGS